MLDLFSAHGLADLGRASVSVLWIPLAAWTAFAILSEIALRLSRPHAMAAVRVRSALLLALPLALLVPTAFAGLIPDAAHAVASARPPQLILPDLTVVAGPVASTAPPTEWVLLGLATLAVLLASGIGLLRWGTALLRLRRVRSGLREAPESLQALVGQTAVRLGLRQRVVAAQCDPDMAPFTFGWRHPVIAIPPSLSGAPLRLAVAHELAHVHHRDFIWNAIEQAIAAIGLAHPLVRVLTEGTALGREQAADAAVLAAHPSDRRSYADLLLSYASLPAPRLALGATQGSSALHTRIAAMKRILSPIRLRQLAATGRTIGVLAAVLLVGSAAALAVPEAMPEPPEWLEGQVTDAATQMGIPGANLVVENPDGDPIGAASGLDGAYRLKHPGRDFTLRITAVGFTPMVVTVGAEQSQLDVALRSTSDRPVFSGEPRDLGPLAPDVFEVVEDPPRLVGGLEGLQARVVYPQQAKAEGIQGRVFVQFIVNEEGGVQDLVVRRSPHPLLSDAALEAVGASEFIPGRQRGQAVKVRYSLPVNFVLRDDNGSDGEDRGANSERNRRPRLMHAGVDLTLLENMSTIESMMIRLTTQLDEQRSQAGEVEYRHTLHPDGTFSNVRVVRSEGSGAIAQPGSEIVEAMILKADRRPPTPREGMFRLTYVGS